MTPHDLLANFEVLAEAPNGIQRLRELVVELAVRGKLVEQDAGDGPAVAYVKQIAAEKTALVKQGRLRDQKALQPFLNAEAPFQIPSSWIWLRAEDLFLVVTDGDHQPPPKAEAGVPFLVIGNVSAGKVDYVGTRFVPQTYFDGLDWTKQPVPHDLLYTVTGSYGIVVEVDSIHPFCVQRHIAILKSPACAFAPFLALALRSPNSYAFATSVATGTAQRTVPLNGLRRMPMPVPPLAEQRRIVARVDELMALLDRLEAKRQDREAARTAARDSALAALREAPTPEDVEAAWLRIKERFRELFTTPEDVEPLRQAVLFLAGGGRLVPQDPREGSAFDLLNQIERAHQPRIKKGATRPNKPNPSPEPVGEPSVLPLGWTWASIEQCCEVVGGIQKTAARRPRNNPYPYLRVANVQRGRFDLSEVAQFELEPGELERWRLEPADLLIVEGNGSEDEIGRCAMWNGQIPNCVHQNHLIRCRAAIPSLAPYILHHLNSPQGISTMKTLAVTTSGLFNLSVGKIRSIRFPMPPEGEQRRILQRVGELMGIVDQLKTTLANECQLATAFAAAAIHHLDA